MWQQFLRNQSFKFVAWLSFSVLAITLVASVILQPPNPVTAYSSPHADDSERGSSATTSLFSRTASNPSPVKTARQELSQELSRVGDRLRDITSHAEKLVDELEAFQDSEEGKRVANSQENFNRMAATIRYAMQEQKEVQQRATEYSTFVTEEVSANDETKLRSLGEQVREFEVSLDAHQQDLENARNAIRAVVDVCRELPPGDKTIRQRVAQINFNEDIEFAKQLKADAEAAEKIRQEAIRIAERDKQTALTELEAAKVRLQAAKVRAQTSDSNIAALKTKAIQHWDLERLRMEREFQQDLSKIRYYLGPILAHGYSQPESHGYQRMVANKGPMSLSALRGLGALNEAPASLSLLASAMSYGNDRDSSICPANTDATRGQYARFYYSAHELLVKYQFLLVEKGMLAE